MDLIIAILVYLGVAGSGSDVTPTMVEENHDAIERYQNDTEFLKYYETNSQTEGIGIINFEEY